MKFEKIKPGMTLLDVHNHKAGNTTMTVQGTWQVRIISIDAEKRTAVVSWNSNKPTTYTESRLSRLREHPPEWLKRDFGGRKCGVCSARESDGHRDDCAHPAAVRARARAKVAKATT